jgi:hypothetical protein
MPSPSCVAPGYEPGFIWLDTSHGIILVAGFLYSGILEVNIDFYIPQEDRKARPRSTRAKLNWVEEARCFKCIHCGYFVVSDPILCGVQNRNHCPYCLCSRHVDLFKAGDRLSACHGEMKPIGLTLKKTRKKYGKYEHGELMLIHHCAGCGKISVNRIAADDTAETIIDIFEDSFSLSEALTSLIEREGIHTLQANDKGLVQAQLMGG